MGLDRVARDEQRLRDLRVRQPLLREPGNAALEAKQLGRRVALRPDWDDVRLEVMRAIIAEKFRSGGPLADRLLATGSAVVIEGNTWDDRFWGVDAHTGHGHNHLGHILMDQRE